MRMRFVFLVWVVSSNCTSSRTWYIPSKRIWKFKRIAMADFHFFLWCGLWYFRSCKISQPCNFLGTLLLCQDAFNIFFSICTQVKAWAELLNAFCTSGRLELELIYKVQTQCYEDAKLMKLFPEIIRTLYDQDVLAEDTVLLWFRKGSNPKGR
jgi:hypothetical protein